MAAFDLLRIGIAGVSCRGVASWECPVATISGLILDVGGVLIETPARDHRRDWERARGLMPGELDDIYLDAIGPGWEGGRSEEEIAARLCASCRIDLSALPDLLEALHADERVSPAWARLLDEVVGSLSLALLTNAGPDTRHTLIPRHGLDRWFRLVVISAEEEISKPDPAIYLRTCERLGLPPSDCLFVDDRQTNVEGARAAGLRAIRFVSGAQTIPQVRSCLGVSNFAVR